jgi:amidophosphoribosyltransferase
LNITLDIRPQDLQIVQKILEASLPKNAIVWVFGSRAKGKARCASDLDLAIDLGRPLTQHESSQLFHAFEGSDLPYTVDVVDLYTVNPSLKKIICQNKIIFPLH